MSEIQHAARSIRAFIERLRGRFVRRAALEGLVWVLPALAAALLLGAVLLGPLELGATARVIALGLLALAALLPWLGAWIAADRRWVRDHNVAARLEAARPELRSDVRAALELGSAPASDNAETNVLREHLLRRVAAMLGAMGEVPAAVPRRDMRRVLGASAVVWLVLGALLLGGPASLRVGAGRLVAGVPAPATTNAPAVATPVVTTLDVEYRYPAYTGLPPKRVRGSTGDLSAIAGTTVALVTQAMFPVRDARIVVGSGETAEVFPLLVEGDRILRGTLSLTRSDDWRIEVEPVAGGPRRVDPVVRRIRIEPDLAPTIELLSPPPTLEIGVSDVIDIEYVASDDFGLGRVELVWYFANDEANQRTMVLQDAGGQRNAQEHVPFELEPLALQPRDEVVAYIQAWDNDAIAGSKPGRSRPIAMRVTAPEDRHAEVLERKQALFENLLLRLGATLPARLAEWTLGEAGALVAVPRTAGPEGLTPLLEGAAAAATGWDETRRLFDELLDAVALDTLSVEADVELLRRAHERLFDATANQARAVNDALTVARGGLSPEALFPAAAAADATLIERTEQTALIFRDLIADHQADDAIRTLQELEDTRERLAELLEQYRNTNDPALREQIERELRRLETRMRELLAQLASQMERLPEEHLNAEGLDPSEMAENVAEMTSSLDSIREALERGDIDAAMQALDQLGQELQSMTSELGGALEQNSGEELSEFDQAMSELMDEINALEQVEQQIESDTARLEADMNRARQEELRDLINERLEDARRRVAELQQELRDTPPEDQLDITRESLLELDRGLEQLESTLESGDVATALEQVATVISGLADLEWNAEREQRWAEANSPEARQAAELLRDASGGRRSMEQVRRDLSDLVAQSQPRPNAQQQSQMGELAQRQAGARERLEQLGQRMEELGQSMPVPSPSGEAMQQVGEGMQQSQDALQGGRPRPAQQGQMQALEGLRTMRQELQQMMRQQRRQQQQQGRSQNNEEVDIPDESEANRARFRQQVLEGMREGGLESYDEQLRHYYESLVR